MWLLCLGNDKCPLRHSDFLLQKTEASEWGCTYKCSLDYRTCMNRFLQYIPSAIVDLDWVLLGL